MSWSAFETISHLAPRVPDALISSDALGRILTLTNRAPLDWSSYYLECRLEQGAEQVDFLAGVRRTDGESLLRQLNDARIRELPWAPEWLRFKALLRDWLAGGPSMQHVPAVWIELDHAGNLDPIAVAPNFCVCVAHDYGCSEVLASRSTESLDTVERVIDVLFAEEAAPAVHRCLRRVATALGQEGKLIHLSLMQTRSPASIKLYVSVPRAQLMSFGERSECAGAMVRVEAILRGIAPHLDPIYLDLTIDEHVAPRIGIAFSQYHRSRADFDPSWNAVLDACVERGVCCPKKRRSLVSWVGKDRVRFRDTSFPVHLDRYLDIKLVSHENSLQAKAYLGFQAKAPFL